jgi:hypothetical protein
MNQFARRIEVTAQKPCGEVLCPCWTSTLIMELFEGLVDGCVTNNDVVMLGTVVDNCEVGADNYDAGIVPSVMPLPPILSMCVVLVAPEAGIDQCDNYERKIHILIVEERVLCESELLDLADVLGVIECQVP